MTTAAATLQEILLAPDTQPKVIDDCCALIEQEVKTLSGISGTAVKVAHKTVITFAPNHIRYMVEALLPKLVDQLQPHWAEFNSSGGGVFGDYLAKNGDQVSEDLLAVTDARAEASDRPVIIKAYRSVRTSAGKHIKAALPRVGDLVMKYAA
ncbi:MAG: hypothetical protein LBV34_06405 [Nocardiopsaceae bacterium]|jgi:hypothetical protein|nr:hypothetical protein [Nocardiopsaceae bacterium]